MHKRPILWAFALVGLALANVPARAQVVYQLANSSGTPQTSFSVGVGQTVAVELFLLDNAATPGGTINQQGGLATAAGRITYTQTTAQVVATTGIAGGPAWVGGIQGNSGTGPTNGFAGISVSVPVTASTGVTVPTTSQAAARVLLGTFTFTGLLPGTTNLTTSDAASGDMGYFNPPFATLNGGAGAPGTLTVSAVPEPTSMALCGLGIAGFAAFRRRRKVAVEEVVAA